MRNEIASAQKSDVHHPPSYARGRSFPPPNPLSCTVDHHFFLFVLFPDCCAPPANPSSSSCSMALPPGSVLAWPVLPVAEQAPWANSLRARQRRALGSVAEVTKEELRTTAMEREGA
nr:unnamed protein product [Digitaria exilis]